MDFEFTINATTPSITVAGQTIDLSFFTPGDDYPPATWTFSQDPETGQLIATRYPTQSASP